MLQSNIYLSIQHPQLNVLSTSSTFITIRNAWAILMSSIKRTLQTEQNYCVCKDKEICTTSIDLSKFQLVVGATILITGTLSHSDLIGLLWLLALEFTASLRAYQASFVNTNTSFKIRLAMNLKQKLHLKKLTKLRKYSL